jgi:hypothetical protein
MRKRAILVGALLVSSAMIVIFFGRDIASEYAVAYPWDTAHRTALMLCTQRDHLFMRFSAADREACYRWALGRT